MTDDLLVLDIAKSIVDATVWVGVVSSFAFLGCAIAERDLKFRDRNKDVVARCIRPARLAFGYTAMLGIGATLAIFITVLNNA